MLISEVPVALLLKADFKYHSQSKHQKFRPANEGSIAVGKVANKRLISEIAV